MEEAQETHWGPKLWDELRSRDPENVCERCAVGYDPAGFYRFSSLGRSVRVYPTDERVESEDEALAAIPDFQLLVVSYLLYAKNIEPVRKWVTEKDLNGGSTFFRGPHALPSAPLEHRFGADVDGFREKAKAISGTAEEFGDASMLFQILPRISFIIVMWLADEEFPARVTLMVDPSVDAHLPLDVVFAMIQTVTRLLTA